MRLTYGTSWRGKRQPGRRYWRSVSYGPVAAMWLLACWLVWWLVCVPVLAMCWLGVELGLLVSSGILAGVLLAMYHKGPDALRLARWGWFTVLDVEVPLQIPRPGWGVQEKDGWVGNTRQALGGMASGVVPWRTAARYRGRNTRTRHQAVAGPRHV